MIVVQILSGQFLCIGLIQLIILVNIYLLHEGTVMEDRQKTIISCRPQTETVVLLM